MMNFYLDFRHGKDKRKYEFLSSAIDKFMININKLFYFNTYIIVLKCFVRYKNKTHFYYYNLEVSNKSKLVALRPNLLPKYSFVKRPL